jgi:integrase
MARTMRASQLETRTARLKLAAAKRPYWTAIGKGVALGYRRNKNFGSWNIRVAKPGGHWTQVIGEADDYADANGATVLDYWQAADKARTLGLTARHGGHGGQLGTVAEALSAYEAELRLNGRDLGNARRVHLYLPEGLAKKAVSTLTFHDFEPWRAALIKAGITPAAFNRTNVGFRAALNLAASRDERIANTRVWKQALANIPGAAEARNVVLDEQQIRAVIAAAYELVDSEFGILVEVASTTGARISQIARLEVADLQADRADARLLMPTSRKGGKGRVKIERRPVPIPASLAARLQAGAAGRPAEAPLLLKASGESWKKSNHSERFAVVVKAAGLDPAVVTFYALRHSSITRQLLSGVPTRLVASLHDTSVKRIEANYSRYISDHSDTIARRAMLDLSKPAAIEKVVPLVRP